MINGPFAASGPTYLVTGASPIQCMATTNAAPSSYRVRNLGSSGAYLAWAPINGISVPSMTVPAAPTAAAPGTNVMGFIATSVETVCLPPNCWFLASSGASFEVTPGEGL